MQTQSQDTNTESLSVSDTHEMNVWVLTGVDVAQGRFQTLFAAHLHDCGLMAQFEMPSGVEITQYRPGSWLLLFHL